MSSTVRNEREVSGFPRRAVLNGALGQTRDDLLSLKGVFITAVWLALANEIFPTPLGRRWPTASRTA